MLPQVPGPSPVNQEHLHHLPPPHLLHCSLIPSPLHNPHPPHQNPLLRLPQLPHLPSLPPQPLPSSPSSVLSPWKLDKYIRDQHHKLPLHPLLLPRRYRQDQTPNVTVSNNSG